MDNPFQPVEPAEVACTLRHFNQVIGQQCRNMALQNHLPVLPDGHRYRLRRRYQTVWTAVGQTQPATLLFRQIRNLLLDLRAEAIGVLE